VYPPSYVETVLTLFDSGHNYSRIARDTGVSRSTIREWVERRPATRGWTACLVCLGTPDRLPPGPYAYLLGLYLGDGYIASHPRGVYKLQISRCNAYPQLMAECSLVMAEILPNRISQVHRKGCTEVCSYSKHWPCLIPQHGPGHKHHRVIALAPWQQSIVDEFPAPFLRGLVHADGCRVLNNVNGRATRAMSSPTHRQTSDSSSPEPVTSWMCNGAPQPPLHLGGQEEQCATSG